MVYALSGMLKFSYTYRSVQKQCEIASAFKTDLLVTEMDPAAYITARITGLPIITTFSKVAFSTRVGFFQKKGIRMINRILRRSGKAPINKAEELINTPRTLRIIPNIPELDGTPATEPNLLYIGNITAPVKKAEPLTIDKSKLLVFVYVGTGSISHEKLRETLPELFADFPELLCCVADSACEKEEKKGNVIFAPYFPAEQLMPRCDLVICHAGLNTITQSLTHGVPLLMFPGPIFERRYNAQMVEKAGAGAMGEISQFRPDWLKEQLQKRALYAEKAAVLSKRFSEMPEIGETVQEIETWIKC